MSHFTSIQTKVRDIAALRDACAELGFDVLENARARGYSANNVPGEYVIKLRGPYDIALNRQPDGTFAMTTDWWNGHVEKEVGTGFGKLMQLYAVHKASREARRKGYSVQRKAQQDGSIKLCIEGA
jgi:hypothetical protein